MSKLVQPGDFCPNRDCADYGKPQTVARRNIIKFGRARDGQQRDQCRTCQHTFTATKGTVFYRRQTPASEIIKALAQLAEGQPISSVTRTTGHKEDTILAWLREAATQVSQIEAVLMADYRLTRGQLDGLWAYVGNKGEKRTILKLKRPASSGGPLCWTSTPGSASRAASRKPKPPLSQEVFQTLKTRGHPDAPPPTMSDGWAGIDDAMIAVYGQVSEYAGQGRPPTRKQPQPGWQYLQMVKHRDAHGHLVNTELRVIFGRPDEVLALSGKSTADMSGLT